MSTAKSHYYFIVVIIIIIIIIIIYVDFCHLAILPLDSSQDSSPTVSSSAQENKWISKTIIHGENLTNYRLFCGRGLGMGGYKFLW